MIFSFLVFFLSLSFATAQEQVVITPSVGLGQGFNVGTIASEIEDTESPDMSDTINDSYGMITNRNGNKRYIGQALGTHPVTSMFMAYASTATDVKKALLISNRPSIYKSTDPVK